MIWRKAIVIDRMKCAIKQWHITRLFEFISLSMPNMMKRRYYFRRGTDRFLQHTCPEGARDVQSDFKENIVVNPSGDIPTCLCRKP
jgi:hypothetical protein